ncbi:DNA mismatch repair protein MutS [Methylobacterium sp. Leaf399]|uniref:Smr/MutS family protein n=1 Tax=unclassified Methylobacterium TaxID=2615210 RepID=UPI0006FEF668|nr:MULTISPECIES: Smr/MutS family protein [unclassified Methylobacterium]KQP61640.1 DNA mismatch repair protein MutS [Methylobacterium sp. Leaf108]KQT20035.1 DNA mismatch repair protein MutS [Methylobacterium sp. Leaf399]KQT78552.1 DNA mismatch repair protein MutS [Methylobacterium sp. Leaf466]
MRPPRRPRPLTGEEASLWNAVARLITPLQGKAVQGKLLHGKMVSGKMVSGKATPGKTVSGTAPRGEAPPAEARPVSPVKVAPPPPQPRQKRVAVKPTPPPAAPAPVARPIPPPAPGLERRTRLALRRGALQVDARIDLHGLYQAQAHGALVGFLMRAQASGHTHILVVTGKGGPSYDDAFSERGVLRRSVPHWLRAPELRGVVLGFEEAARHHGGAGALYVRLKRR